MTKDNKQQKHSDSTEPAIAYSTCYAQPSIQLFNCDNLKLMTKMEDESVDVILTDPPYLYLKNQKLERPFDEQLFFSECKRVLTKDGFIVMFGRGTSFYRWNTILDDLGFNFKEEIVWNKSYNTSPLMALSRVHETVSIFTKGKGTINRVKVPYMEMKSHDLDSVIGDVKRMRSILKNTKSLDAVLAFLENNKVPTDKENTLSTSISSIVKTQDRCASVLNGITNGVNEKPIIRTDLIDETFTKFGVIADKRKTGDRCTNAMQSIAVGLNEKSIIKQVHDHYSAIHPTQKPVRLLERLLALVIPQDKEPKDIIVADFFGGSFSTMEAVYNMGMQGIACEIDKEYFEAGKERIEKLPTRQTSLFT
jgi:site-specific DNA-methyltransferase (adenine-specific)